MKPLLIVKAGETFAELAESHGDFEDWIAHALRPAAMPVEVHDARTAPVPAPDRWAGVVVTGSHAMVSDRTDWSEDLAGWMRSAVEAEVPLLGICFGHQLLAHALGGEVGYRTEGPDVGTVEIELSEAAANDSLFASLPATFTAPMVHMQSVLRLPSGALPLARHPGEPHAAFRVGAHAWGVQFHPEFHTAAMQGYLHQMRETLERHGLSPVALTGALKPTPHAASLLPTFGRWVRQRQGRRQTHETMV